MLNINKVYHGDCIEVMRSIEDKSIDLILCDLPYGLVNYDWDDIISFELLWWNYKRIVKDNGSIVLTSSQPFTSKLIMSNLPWFRHEIIWEKDNGTNFAQVNVSPFKVHENILVFSKKHANYFPQMTEGKPYSVIRSQDSSEGGGNFSGKRTSTINKGTRYPRSVQKFNREIGLHSNQKPVDLFEWLIKTYSSEGMTVLDNCAGSGTTAIACINTNRNYILIEKDDNYFNVCNERILNHLKENSPLV